MKKYLTIILMAISLYALFSIGANADETDYDTFVEIIMPRGKLLKNFTEDDMNEALAYVHNRIFYGLNIHEISSNVDATYISSTIQAITNDTDKDDSYKFDVTYETNNKVSFSTSGNLSGGLAGAFKNKVKGDLSGKLGVDFSITSTTSKKQTEKLEIVIEKHSRLIMYLDGNLSVSNGVIAIYSLWLKVGDGAYEIVTLKNQYVRLEKTKI